MTILALAPFAWKTPLVALALGVAFGFVLERSGFGDARRLAAQFTLREMRVLKVMFTAIVTCLLLLTGAASLGLLDFQALSINPTYLWPGLLGGLLLGVGFVVGGYCPGTSIVSAATLKIDGALFVLGVAAGGFVFGEVGGAFLTWYDTSGALGVFTLPEALGLPFGVVVALVVLMAALMMWGGTLLERRHGDERDLRAARLPWRPAARAAALGAMALAVAFLARPAAGEGSVQERMRLLAPEADRILASGAVHVDPLEALGLMHGEIGGQPARFHLEILDLRDESDFNRFHLLDARRTSLEQLRGEDGRALGDGRLATSIKLLVANDQAPAEEAWRILHAQRVRNVYVLAGGVNLWLDVFREGRPGARAREGTAADERMAHAFDNALGARQAFARPGRPVLERLRKAGVRPTATRVKPVSAAPMAAGGCG